MESKDIIAICILVAVSVLLALGRISAEQFLYVLMIIVGYYFGYTHGVRVGARRKEGS